MTSTRKLLFGKTLLIAFISTIILTLLLVYFTGLRSHRSILDNSIVSLLLLSLFFFLFLVFGLFNGLRIYDDFSNKLHLTWKRAKKRMPDGLASSGFNNNMDIPDVGDDIGGIIAGIILWVFISIALIVLLTILQAVVWLTIVLLVMAIYWIFIRALKLIFSKSKKCENNLLMSIKYALGYTFIYSSWLYVILYLSTQYG